MAQSSPSDFSVQSYPSSNVANPPPTIKRAKCTVRGCGKLFNRKEHLTRHLKSHDPQLQYECPICSRRYARSDVFKRHVEHHSQDSNSKRTLVACAYCHERKLKCDDNIPCRSCTRNSTECSRVAAQQDGGMSMGADTSDESWNGSTVGNDRALRNQTNEMSIVIPSHNPQQSWYPSVQEMWPLAPYSTPGLGVSFPEGGNPNSPAQWLMDSGEREYVGGAFSGAAVEDVSFTQPATIGPRVESLSSSSWSDVNQRERTASPLASQSSPPARTFREDQMTSLQHYLNEESLSSRRLIDIYFTELHSYWPILHAPTFNPDQATAVLLGSMIVLASWLKGELGHQKLAPLVFDAVTSALLDLNPSSSEAIKSASLQTLQALLLSVVYTTSCLTVDGMKARAVQFNGILISSCRQLGMFDGRNRYDSRGDGPFSFWLAQEQLHRLAFAALRIDAYLSLLVDHPPSVRYQEICIPLPKSTYLWTADSEEERRSLQWNEPAGREKAHFCFLMRDALDLNRRHYLPNHLTEADYHLGLCALQNGTWEAACDAHRCESDDLTTSSDPTDPIQLWRTRLHQWRGSMEKDCHTRQRYFSASASSVDHIFAPLNLILWHLSVLTTHAPLKFLQGQGCCFKCYRGVIGTKQRAKARLSNWLQSPCSRLAVWNAAQICHIFVRESTSPTSFTHVFLDPLGFPGILKSAIVVCTYAYNTRACPACTGGPPIDVVDLFGAADEDTKLIDWKEKGEILASWGPGEFPVCHCKITALATWFRSALSRNKGAEQEFTSFLAKLDKEQLL